jgi:glycine cleavage system H protein
LLYSKEHEWLRMEGDEGIIGITDFAQKELGDIVYLEFPEVGRVLQAGEEFGTVESVKAVSEVYSPVGGEITAVNGALTEDPDRSAVVNQDPYGEGWLIKIRLGSRSETEGLMDAGAYRSFVEEGSNG